MGQPDAAADDAVVADVRISAEDGGAGVDDDPVADVGMTLDPLDEGSVLSDIEALGAQRYMLIELDVLADGGGLADDDAPGWMSMPVRRWAYSVMTRGRVGMRSRYSTWARR